MTSPLAYRSPKVMSAAALTQEKKTLKFAPNEGNTCRLNTPLQVLDQERLHVHSLHARQPTRLDIVKQQGRDGARGGDEVGLVLLLAAVVADFGRRGEDVCDADQTGEGGPVSAGGSVDMADDVEYGEGAVQSQSGHTRYVS